MPSTMVDLTNQGKETSVWFIPFNRQKLFWPFPYLLRDRDAVFVKKKDVEL